MLFYGRVRTSADTAVMSISYWLSTGIAFGGTAEERLFWKSTFAKNLSEQHYGNMVLLNNLLSYSNCAKDCSTNTRMSACTIKVCRSVGTVFGLESHWNLLIILYKLMLILQRNLAWKVEKSKLSYQNAFLVKLNSSISLLLSRTRGKMEPSTKITEDFY